MAHVSVEIELLFESAIMEWVRDRVKKRRVLCALEKRICKHCLDLLTEEGPLYECHFLIESCRKRVGICDGGTKCRDRYSSCEEDRLAPRKSMKMLIDPIL